MPIIKLLITNRATKNQIRRQETFNKGTLEVINIVTQKSNGENIWEKWSEKLFLRAIKQS